MPANWDGIRLVRESVSVPVVGNGDVFKLGDALRLHEETGVTGVMAARGLLANPALFRGDDVTPRECFRNYVDLTTQYGTPFTTMQQTVLSMGWASLSRSGEWKQAHVERWTERLHVSMSRSVMGIVDTLGDAGLIDPAP